MLECDPMASSLSLSSTSRRRRRGRGHPHPLTHSQKQKQEVERHLESFYRSFASYGAHLHSPMLELWRDQHIGYLLCGLDYLNPGFCALDASRPWLCYWALNSLALLGQTVSPDLYERTMDFLMRCKDPSGGYGGGPGQMPHLATTYASVFALATLGGEALASIDREKLLEFLLRMKDPSGGFRVHENGEMDVRGCYTAVAVAHLLDILTPPLVENVADYIVSCQTFEGGIAGEPSAEAHGGYTYCGLAALALINQAERLDLPRLVNWAVFRQGNTEGGLQGRVNKLVDGCYSFWQGALFPILKGLAPHIFSQHAARFKYFNDESEHGLNYSDQNYSETEADTTSDARNAGNYAEILFPCLEAPSWNWSLEGTPQASINDSFMEPSHEETSDNDEHQRIATFFNSQALQGYILLCCQVREGGLRDKPGKSRDFYHTCYCLSGLSIAQHCSSKRFGSPPLMEDVLGPYNCNLLAPIHPLCNIVLERYHNACRYFSSLPSVGL